MTTEFEGGGSLLHDQRMQTVRNLFCAGGDGGLFLENNFSLTTACGIATQTCEFEAYEKSSARSIT